MILVVISAMPCLPYRCLHATPCLSSSSSCLSVSQAKMFLPLFIEHRHGVFGTETSLNAFFILRAEYFPPLPGMPLLPFHTFSLPPSTQHKHFVLTQCSHHPVTKVLPSLPCFPPFSVHCFSLENITHIGHYIERATGENRVMRIFLSRVWKPFLPPLFLPVTASSRLGRACLPHNVSSFFCSSVTLGGKVSNAPVHTIPALPH